jgi:hypothetical protein
MFLVYERRRGSSSTGPGSKDSNEELISGEGGEGSGGVKAAGAGRGIRAFASGADAVSGTPIMVEGFGRGFSDMLTCCDRGGW